MTPISIKPYFAWFSLVTSVAIGCTSTSSGRYTTDQFIYLKNKNQDSKEYIFVVDDEEFYQWFSEHAKPLEFYSPSYYVYHNKIYSINWNDLYLKGGGIKPFNRYIPYRPEENYGVALNHQLFWYFRFIEARYGSGFVFNAQL